MSRVDEMFETYNKQLLPVRKSMLGYIERAGTTKVPLDVTVQYLVDLSSNQLTLLKQVVELVGAQHYQIEMLKAQVKILQDNKKE